MRVELRKVLKKYGVPLTGALSDNAYAYIAENYQPTARGYRVQHLVEECGRMSTESSPPPDERWQHFIRGIGEAGEPLPMTHDALVRVTHQWPTTQATPSGISGLLSTARGAFGLAWFQYEMLVVAATWSMFAVEGALRECLDASDKESLKNLLGRAQREGHLSAQQADRTDAGRDLRNRLVHARQQDAWTIGMAEPVLAASHEIVSALYPEPRTSP